MSLLAAVSVACGAGVDGLPGRPPVITSLFAEATPMESVLDVTWSCPRAEACALSVTASEELPGDLPASGRRRVAVDFAAAAHRPEVELSCSGPDGDAVRTTTAVVPYIASFTATPASVPAEGTEVVLCWEMAQGQEPLCAIRALNSGEYYYPLEAEGCLFPLFVDQTSEFLLYCSPANGYVEAALVVPAQAP